MGKSKQFCQEHKVRTPSGTCRYCQQIEAARDVEKKAAEKKEREELEGSTRQEPEKGLDRSDG